MYFSYESIVCLAVILFGVLGFVKPTLFAHIFRPRGMLKPLKSGEKSTDPLGFKSFANIYSKEKAELFGRLIGVFFVVIGIIGFLKYGFLLF
ncbi:Uncharacterised protein [uncultured archaeon]|nr:Uncharacterised protein [uncultured archaeon]